MTADIPARVDATVVKALANGNVRTTVPDHVKAAVNEPAKVTVTDNAPHPIIDNVIWLK